MTDPPAAHAFFRHAFLRHAPQRHARMLPPTSPTKYHNQATPISDALLARHLAGELTLAAPSAHADLGCLIPFDIDSGGLPALTALLAAAQTHGAWAFGQLCPRADWPDAAQRGYVWIVVRDLTNVARLRAFGQTILDRAALPPGSIVELRTSHADTRLPLGRHTHTGQFGTLHLQDGTCRSIDDDPAAALALLQTHMRMLAVRRLPEAPAPPASPHTPCGTRRRDIIQTYNAVTDLRALLVAHGGRRRAYRLYHCPCGQHAHDDARPSLGLVAARDPARHGPWLVKGFAPHCRFHRATDAFGVLCALTNRTPTDAVAAIRALWQTDDQRLVPPPVAHPSDPGPRKPYQPVVRPPTCSTQQATQLRERLWLQLAQDGDLPKAARTIMRYLLEEATAQETISCQRSKRQIARATGLCPRSIQLACRRLAAHGYLTVRACGTPSGGDMANLYVLGDAAIPDAGGDRGRTVDSPPIKLNHALNHAADPAARIRLGRGDTLPAPPASVTDRLKEPPVSQSRQKPPKAAAPPPPADAAVRTRVLAILNGVGRSLTWLSQLGRDPVQLAQAGQIARQEARRLFAQGQTVQGRRRMWQAKEIEARCALFSAEPDAAAAPDLPAPPAVAPVAPETPQAARLAAIGVYPGSIAQLAHLPLPTVEAAIALAQSVPEPRQSVAALTVAFLKRHRDDGWVIPAPAAAPDAPLDLAKYTTGAYADFFARSLADEAALADAADPDAAAPPTDRAGDSAPVPGLNPLFARWRAEDAAAS